MELNIHPGRGKAVVNLNGPCRLDVMRGGHVISKMEVPSGEVYTLVARKKECAEDDASWFEY